MPPVQKQPQQQAATRAMTPQQAAPPSATRVDLHTPPRPVPTQQPPSNHRPAAAPQYSQRPKPASQPLSSKSKKSTMYTALAIVAAAVIGIMFASMISNNNDRGGSDNSAGGNTQTQQTQGSTQPSTPSKSSGKAGQWTDTPTDGDKKGLLEEYFQTAPSKPDDAWQMGNANFQGQYPGGLDGFKTFWGTVKQVEVSSVEERQPYYFVVTLDVTKKDGTKSTIQRQVSLEWRSPNFLLSYDKPFGNGA
ncbi:hypothetical protein FXN61_15955 [Lentzea sp. PSKA42]|uniref:Uncharacterized protein n=1 Tax=Lentzea indica TaxID=2604800 RepID=A0ABX1FHL0_9PSEU|nr:hypothetical protein [Lentzea indica]NKE58234.1 hypothetical protein [Lentzea indica]